MTAAAAVAVLCVECGADAELIDYCLPCAYRLSPDTWTQAPIAGTATSPLVGRTEPRLWTRPLRDLTPETSLGFECIAFAFMVLGMRLDPWQCWFLIHALELREDGSFRFRTVLLLVARQNGKTTVMRALSLWAILTGRIKLVVGTAQDLDVARECWTSAVDTVESDDELVFEIASTSRPPRATRANGKEELRLINGCRYKIKATNDDAGRGIPGVGLLLLDELRTHKTRKAWAALSKTTLAIPNALIVGMSNAGDDESVVLNDLRQTALDAATELDRLVEMAEQEARADLDELLADSTVDTSIGIFEWSAPDGCLIADRQAWVQANPSLGYGRITERALMSAMSQDRDESAVDPEALFRTECLCQRVSLLRRKWRVVSAADWAARAEAFAGALPALALEVAYDRSSATFAGAGPRPDGRTQIGTVEHRDGTDWVVPWARDTWAADEKPRPLVVDPKGPAGWLIPELEAAGVPVVEADLAGVINAYAWLVEGIGDDKVRHCGDQVLTAAAEAAGSRPVGDRVTWDRKTTGVAPVVAASLALWGLSAPEPQFFGAWR